MFFGSICFVVFVAQALAYPWSNTVEWIDVTNYDAVLLRRDPAGYENGVKLFLCRVIREQNQVPGKLVFHNGNTRCVIPYRGIEIQSPTFQVLVSYPGVVSWKPYSVIGGYSVFAGRIDSHITYVCRARFSNTELLIGAFNDDTKTCNVAKDGGEYSKRDHIEILEKNSFGTAMNTPIPRP